MGKSSLAVVLILTLFASVGCSLGSIGKRGRPKAAPDSEEIAALKAHIVELQRRSAVAEVEIARLAKRLAEVENTAQAARDERDAQAKRRTARSGAPPAADVSASAEPVTAVSGNLDRGDLEVSDLPVETPDTTTDTSGGDTPGGEEPPSSAEVTLTASAQALYDRGYTLFHQGHFVDSETAFQQFLRRYSATVLGDNAQFWIAEARYAREDVSGALAAYQETVTRFPEGNKVPDAQLKIGDCLRELGDTEAARESYRTVIREFPGAAAATAARERLAQLP